MLELPIEATPSQQFLATLNEQNCIVNLYQRGSRLYIDLLANDVEVVKGAVCLPGVPLVQRASADFDGNFYFTDELSPASLQEPPNWKELGTRFRLFYLAPDEMNFLVSEREALAMGAVDD